MRGNQSSSPSPHSVSPVLSVTSSDGTPGSLIPHQPSNTSPNKSAHVSAYSKVAKDLAKYDNETMTSDLSLKVNASSPRKHSLLHEIKPKNANTNQSNTSSSREESDANRSPISSYRDDQFQEKNFNDAVVKALHSENDENLVIDVHEQTVRHDMTCNHAQQQHLEGHPKRKIHPTATNKPSDFRSFAIYCEVKLVEMLNKDKYKHKNQINLKKNLSTPNGPDIYRTNVCCELLGEICEMSMPFSRVLGHIRNELLSAIYSTYVLPHDGSLAFEQIPYFEVVGKLEKKNLEMEHEQERWKETLHARQQDIYRIEEHMEELKEQAFASQSHTKTLEDRLQTTLKSLETATTQVKRLKKELAKSRAEETKARMLAAQQMEEKQKFERLKILHTQLVHELQACQMTLETTRQECLDRVPKSELDQAQVKIVELTGKLALSIPKDLKSGGMTPRPNWMNLRGKSSPYRAPTIDQATDICKANEQLTGSLTTLRLDTAAAKVALAEVTEKFKEIEGLLPPDPLVLSKDIVSLLVESANKSIRAMGVGEDLPRFLRCTYDFIRITNLTMEAIQKIISDTWNARLEQIETKATIIPLFDFIYAHLLKKMGQHIDVVEFMYNMLITLKKTPRPWPSDVELFQLILLGQLSEETYWDRVRMFKVLFKVFDTLNGKIMKDGRRMLKISEASSLLEKIFPRKPPKQILILQSALKESSKDSKNIFYQSEDDPEQTFHPPDIFFDTVGHQHLDEIKDYVDGLQKAVKNFTKGKGVDGRVALDDISASIMGYDSRKTQNEVDSLLVVATNFGCSSEINTSKAIGVKLDVNTILTRMTRTCLLKPSGNYDFGLLLKRKSNV